MNTADNDHILIIGAGFAGVGLGIQLKQAGIHDFTILERAASLGGTWRDNTYPGVACDVPSYVYSYSFEPNPDWSRFFAPQREILAYLERCADKYGVREHIRFDSGVVGATFDERSGLWTVETVDGQKRTARVMVSGAGHALSKPVFPRIPGRESFAGKAMHSARWDHDFRLEGKRVAVIGTGASAMQLVPELQRKVGKLSVFQRTPAWVLSRPDRAITPQQRALFARNPWLQKLARRSVYWFMESLAVGYIVDTRFNALRERLSLRHLASQVPDPNLRAKLTPTFRLGCKRALFSNEFYPAIQQPNAELVTDAITEIRAHSIVTSDGVERPVDAIVYATGYEAADAKPTFPIVGRHGLDLRDAWRGGLEAFLGTSITGFPNAFLLLGPNVGLGHSSMIFMMEAQFRYIVDAIQAMRARSLKLVDVRAEAQTDYNAWLQTRLARTVWNTGGCSSWYLNENGKNTTAWPGFTFEFRHRTRRFLAESYECVSKSRVEEIATKGATALPLRGAA